MIILASASPRRRELLQNLNLTFEVRPTDCDESSSTTDPGEYVAEISLRKAQAATAYQGDIIIAADTSVYIDGQILGKPESPSQAAAMLKLLSGRAHSVFTGLTVIKGGTITTHVEQTKVTFRTLSQKHIDDYIASGEPFDKAGAYGIQGLGSALIERIEGDFFNVMGLPVCALCKILEK